MKNNENCVLPTVPSNEKLGADLNTAILKASKISKQKVNHVNTQIDSNVTKNNELSSKEIYIKVSQQE